MQAGAWWSRATQYKTITVRDADRTLFPGGGSQVAPCEYVRAALSRRLTKERLANVRMIAIRRNWDPEKQCWMAITTGDGTVQMHQEVLDELHAKLWASLSKPNAAAPGMDDPAKVDIIKVLAWTGFDDPAFEKYILSQLSSQKAAIHGTGNGVRSPDGCAKVIRFLAGQIKWQLRHSPDEVQGVNEPLRQLSWLLAQREEATSRLEDSEVMEALDAVFQCALRLHEHGNRQVMFQWSIRCLVLMLTRRRFSVDFLDPSCSKSVELIRFCADVYMKVAPADLFIRDLSKKLDLQIPQAATDQNTKVARFIRSFFEYIHRRGTGSLIVED